MGTEKLKVLWENEDVMVIDKPAGLLSLREEGAKGESVQDRLDEMGLPTRIKYDDDVFVGRGGIAHRLDRETSGVLLVAKNPASLKHLMDQFKKRLVDKQYIALVHGWIEPEEGRVKLPISGEGGVRQGIRYDGKMADTAWKTVDRFLTGFQDKSRLSLLDLKIYTGRTHQIRVHLAHLGYPVFSDSKYLSVNQRRLDRQKLSRHSLHAREIEFSLPGSKKSRQKVVSELPKDLLFLVKRLSVLDR